MNCEQVVPSQQPQVLQPQLLLQPQVSLQLLLHPQPLLQPQLSLQPQVLPHPQLSLQPQVLPVFIRLVQVLQVEHDIICTSAVEGKHGRGKRP